MQMCTLDVISYYIPQYEYKCTSLAIYSAKHGLFIF